MSGTTGAPGLDLGAVLADPAVQVVVCCGSGGVGKTTTAAALALRAAEHGRRVVVLTIDPARRLAQSLGLVELDNTPRPVAGVDTSAGGSLDAMMLDMKRTFDEVVLTHASPEAAQEILDNPVYQAVSSSFAGTQEYMAMERLGQLRAQAEAEGRWDLIVVDTPPSRSALDFLDAPARLGSFLDGRFIRLLTAPARVGGRASLKLFGTGMSVVNATLGRLLGRELLRDVQTFVLAMDTVFGGFRARADTTYALLQDDATRFVVVATPERDALREAGYFVQRLATDRMPLAGLVLNRVTVAAAPLSSARATAAAEALDEADPAAEGGPTHDAGEGPAWAPRHTAALLRTHADRAEVAARQRQLIQGFTAGHPRLPAVQVPAAAADIADLDGLRLVGSALAGGPGTDGSAPLAQT
ncbi:ArsA family ATPase [Ornithinicoccus hortensis]|uniref:Anion-transporting ArsA/GET3 family ATPase n=1 Tax=Ornithinicoccus hortensis TaxID=82346 RepID=A0A542YW50_9MICO|nr:ArsA-related P-loop ATPase [Ornithinicoccus hortensis]TQL52297.1 anion-transporting ArsA/GET3 family ATPase [Ornithinicoccus hortensis]